MWRKKVPKLKAMIQAEKNKPKSESSSSCIHGDDNCARCAINSLDSPEAKTTKWYPLVEDDIKRCVYNLPTSVVEAMKRAPKEVVVAGGFIRSMVGREPVNDIDVFVTARARTIINALFSWKKVGLNYIVPANHSTGDPEIQVIDRYNFLEPVNILESFDYTVVKAAIWYDAGNDKQAPNFKGIHHERFYKDLARKTLVFETGREDEGILSITRIMKYVRYGYTADPASLATAVLHTCLSLDFDAGYEGMLKQIQDAYIPYTTVQSWTELTKKYTPPARHPATEYSSGS